MKVQEILGIVTFSLATLGILLKTYEVFQQNTKAVKELGASINRLYDLIDDISDNQITIEKEMLVYKEKFSAMKSNIESISARMDSMETRERTNNNGKY